MAPLTGAARAMWRALEIQASWSYERMQGVGLAFSLAPIYRHLFAGDVERERAALGRASSFFNANPYFAPAALGALARVEADDQPATQIVRLRTALGGPLGALGDRLFWAALVPGLMSLLIVAIALGAGPWVLLAGLLAYNLFRFALARWLFVLGWSAGFGVGKALGASWVPRVSSRLVTPAILLSALAIPVGSRQLLEGGGLVQAGGSVLLALGMLVLRRFTGTRGTAPLLTFAVAALVLLWEWGKA